MPRTRLNLTLDAIWDLEDQYTALAGSASGRAVVVPQVAATPASKVAPHQKVTSIEKVVHAVKD